jgi:hypothetical protein
LQIGFRAELEQAGRRDKSMPAGTSTGLIVLTTLLGTTTTVGAPSVLYPGLVAADFTIRLRVLLKSLVDGAGVAPVT